MTACSAWHGHNCGQDVTQVMTTGCIHEHVRESSLCDQHAADARAGRMGCTECFDVDGHRCAIHVLERSAHAIEGGTG